MVFRKDNLTWVFNLKKGIKFHNGKEITSEDVKFSLERLLDPKLNSPNGWLLEIIEGSEDFKKGAANMFLVLRYWINIESL